MINILHQAPVPSTALRPHHDLAQGPPRQPLRQIVNGPNRAREDRITSWLEGTSSSSNVYGLRHPHTPPLRSSDVVSVNSMLAPSHGGLYKGSTDSRGYYQPVPPRQTTPRAHATDSFKPPGATAEEEVKDDASEASQIVTYLQIPSSINNSKGSLSEFAAQVRVDV